MRYSPNAAALLLVLVLVVSFSCSPKEIRTIDKLPTAEPGLQLFPTPRDFDPPGQIISIDEDGGWFHEKDLSSQFPTEPKMEVHPAIFYDSNVEAGLAISVLGGAITSDAVRRRHVTLQMAAMGTKREIIQGSRLRKVLEGFVGDLTHGKEYFIITETVLADSVEFRIDQSSIDSLGGRAQLGLIVNANPNLVMKDSLAVQLVMRFPKPLRVFYKVRSFFTETEGVGVRCCAFRTVLYLDNFETTGLLPVSVERPKRARDHSVEYW